MALRESMKFLKLYVKQCMGTCILGTQGIYSSDFQKGEKYRFYVQILSLLITSFVTVMKITLPLWK